MKQRLSKMAGKRGMKKAGAITPAFLGKIAA
jgi:hypothetical protein